MEDILNQYDILSCNKNDIHYPGGMKNLSGMPSILYYRGNISIINQNKNIAVVGSRKSSPEGTNLAYTAGRIAAEEGLNLVNGLALGCDTEALRGALSMGGKCVAVMPCGLEQIQPKSNIKLAESILQNGGCLISQYPIGTAIRDYQYVERDRIQSGISQGVLIVEAQEKSGTMHTADFAVRQYRRLACYYYGLVNYASGNRYLEQAGKAKALRTEQDLRKFYKDVAEEEIFEQISFEIPPFGGII